MNIEPTTTATVAEQPIVWKKFEDARPYTSVIGFAFDEHGRFPIFFRSNKVRSAKNAWSMPSGLHEIGLPFWHQFKVELKEELNIEMDTGPIHKIGFYENIIRSVPGEDNWHWVLLLVAAKVKSLGTLMNMEPEKHSDIRVVTVDELYSQYMDKTWSKNLKEALLEYQPVVRRLVKPSETSPKAVTV